MRFDVLALAIAFLAGLVWIYRRDQARGRARRTGALDPCREVLAGAAASIDSAGFPMLRGQYRGCDVRLELLVEAVSVRKLPQLLLKVTLVAPVATRGVLDIMQRPLNVEFYSPAGDLPHTLQRPSGWPEPAIVKSDRKEMPVPPAILDHHIGLFDDPKVKELLIAPRGLRVVYRLAEAERSTYLVLRQAQFANDRPEPAQVHTLLDKLLALREDLASANRDARQSTAPRGPKPAIALGAAE